AIDEALPDITSESIFERGERGHARFIAKEAGIIAGLTFAEATFKAVEADATFERGAADGEAVEPGAIVAEASASVIALLSGERTALNLMQRASGIATLTRRYVDAVRGTKATIVDTRKTAPGLRAL